jgi:hypothetical protein
VKNTFEGFPNMMIFIKFRYSFMQRASFCLYIQYILHTTMVSSMLVSLTDFDGQRMRQKSTLACTCPVSEMTTSRKYILFVFTSWRFLKEGKRSSKRNIHLLGLGFNQQNMVTLTLTLGKKMASQKRSPDQR